jgi:asparagine synthase (glutamine-hydrolysing)
MCGIAGSIDFAGCPVPRTWLDEAARLLRHRGPDGTTIDLERSPAGTGVGFAHCRLRIIDLLPRADQPLRNAACVSAGRATPLALVFNGEIYNYRELRTGLESRGHRFTSESDTEVLLHLYEEEGERLLHRLRGMFAFALWDEAGERLFCARDRVGKKPLYYHAAPGRFSFASTPRALLARPDVSPAIDPAAIAHFLTIGYVAGPGSAFASLTRLPPAHFAIVTREGVRVERYWTLQYGPKATVDEGEAIAEFRRLLGESVRLRLVSDVPLGAFLSGGLDSAAVVAAMAAEAARVQTFSIGFDDRRYDELPGARAIAERFGTEHHEFVVTPRAAEIVETLAWHYGEPFADSSAVPMYYLARLARQQITVALTGDGGDESLAGYRRYGAHLVAARAAAAPLPLRRALARSVDLLPGATGTRGRLYDARRFLASLAETPARRYQGWFGFFEPDSPVIARHLREAHGRTAVDHLARLFKRHDASHPVDQAMGVDIESYLPDDLLVKADIAAMAHGVEARAPLLDHRLMEFCAALPVALKRRGRTGKYLLRRAMAGGLPEPTLAGRKQGFGVPLDAWFRGPLGDVLGDAIESRHGSMREFVEPAAARRLLEEHRSGRGAHGHRLWALLMLDLWHRAR